MWYDSIAFLGSLGSEVEKRVRQLSSEYSIAFLDLRAAFSSALKEQLLLHLRREKRAALEEALNDQMSNESESSPGKGEDTLWQLLSLSSNNVAEVQADVTTEMWQGLQEDTQQKLYQEALRSVLHPEMGPAFIQGRLLLYKNGRRASSQPFLAGTWR